MNFNLIYLTVFLILVKFDIPGSYGRLSYLKD